MKDYRKIYIVTAFNIDKIRKLAKKKFVTPVWHNEPEIYLDRCYLVSKEYNTQTKKYIKTIQDDEDVYYICKHLEIKNYIIKHVSKNGEPINIMENPGYHKDVYKQLCHETKTIFQDDLKEKCPKTVYQYGPLIDEYNELCESSSDKCLQLYQAANDEMSKAIKAYYQSYFDNFDETVAKLKQQYNI